MQRTMRKPCTSASLRPPRMHRSEVLPLPEGPSTPSRAPGLATPLTPKRIWRRRIGGERTTLHQRFGAAISGTLTNARRRRHSSTSGSDGAEATSGGAFALVGGSGAKGAPLTASDEGAMSSAGPPSVVPCSPSSTSGVSSPASSRERDSSDVHRRAAQRTEPSSSSDWLSSDRRARCGGALSSMAQRGRARVWRRC